MMLINFSAQKIFDERIKMIQEIVKLMFKNNIENLIYIKMAIK